MTIVGSKSDLDAHIQDLDIHILDLDIQILDLGNERRFGNSLLVSEIEQADCNSSGRSFRATQRNARTCISIQPGVKEFKGSMHSQAYESLYFK